MVNSKGQLIVISTSTVTEAQNLNFAIPVNDVLAVYKQDGVKQNEINYSEGYYDLALAYHKKGDFETEIIYLKKAMAINPEYADAYYDLGKAYTQKGDIDNAIIYFKKAIDINPEDAESYYKLGLLYREKEDNYLEQYYLEKAYKLDPSLRK